MTIPKIIHFVWLSGDEKPEIYKKCLDSWRIHMPEYDYQEWTLKNLPNDVVSHPFVSSALKAKKWAFATDYIRVWALYNFGGVYMDLDVEVFRSFDPFLSHSAFCCIEYNPKNYIKFIKKRKTTFVRGLNIEAAVIGALKNHIWIKEILDYYDTLKFSTDKEVIETLIMPLIITKVSLNHGFKYVPLYQVLDCNVNIYPPDTFSSCYNMKLLQNDYSQFEKDCTRYALHKVAHSWYENNGDNKFIYNLKKSILNILGKKNIDKMKRLFKNNIIDQNI